MTKNFVLDTNVMLHDPAALTKFEENNIILVPTVIAELDHHKNYHKSESV